MGPANVSRVTSAMAALLALGVGCSAPQGSDLGGSGERVSATAPTPSPVQAAGVADCSSLLSDPDVDGEDTLPRLRLPCLTERSAIDVHDLAGRATVVNLWATWCGPCRDEMPVLEAAFAEARGEVQFVGIDTKDDTEGAAAFLEEIGVGYPQLVDVDGLLLSHLRIPGLPVTLVLDASGAVVEKQIGPVTPERLDEMVAAASP